MVAIENLDAFSRDIAERLFAAHPEWKAFARIEVGNDAVTPGYLVVEITPPAEAKVDHSLLITTEDEEVTIGLDYYHSHFEDFASPSGDPASDGMAFLKGLLCDHIAVVSWWNGETCVGSSTIGRDEELAPMPHKPSYDRIRIRSWQGTRNRDLTGLKVDAADRPEAARDSCWASQLAGLQSQRTSQGGGDAVSTSASPHLLDPRNHPRFTVASQFRVITTSRYSLGTTIELSPERLNRSINANRSRWRAPCAEGSSAAKLLSTGP